MASADVRSAVAANLASYEEAAGKVAELRYRASVARRFSERSELADQAEQWQAVLMEFRAEVREALR